MPAYVLNSNSSVVHSFCGGPERGLRTCCTGQQVGGPRRNCLTKLIFVVEFYCQRSLVHSFCWVRREACGRVERYGMLDVRDVTV